MSSSSTMNENAKQRIKFQCMRESSNPSIKESEWKPLARALILLEELGAAPLAIDGKVCGNGAALSNDDTILVSKSGRYGGEDYGETQFVRLTSFDRQSWTATFSSVDPTAKPSSDAPLLWYSIMVAPKKFGWEKQPQFILHGHTCKTSDDAKRLNVPCSTKETMFSTPADLDALIDLFEDFPYPQHNIFVRLNHGFFMLADSPEEAVHLIQTKLGLRKKLKEQVQVQQHGNKKRKETNKTTVQERIKKSKKNI